MAAPATSTTHYKAPEWAVKNRAIFLSCQKGVPPPPPTQERTQLEIDASSLIRTEPIEAARSMAVVAATRENRIRPPTQPPRSDYFRNVANHPDVLSTIISTARHYVGFPPPFSGDLMTEQQAAEYILRLNNFIRELNGYYAYIDLVSAQTHTVQNNSIDCSAMLDSIVTVLATALRVAIFGPDFEALKEGVSALIRLAVNGVSEQEKSTSAGFEMLGLPASNVENEPPTANPTSAVTFTLTRLSRNSNNKSTVEDSFLAIACYSYTLKSSAIIEYAEYLAGSEIIGNEELVESINKNL